MTIPPSTLDKQQKQPPFLAATADVCAGCTGRSDPLPQIVTKEMYHCDQCLSSALLRTSVKKKKSMEFCFLAFPRHS